MVLFDVLELIDEASYITICTVDTDGERIYYEDYVTCKRKGNININKDKEIIEILDKEVLRIRPCIFREIAIIQIVIE